MPLHDDKKRAYQRQWWHRRRNEWIDSHGPCAFCGSASSPQVDHVDPAIKVSHRIWSWSQPRREKELENCRILCRDCHKKRHGSAHGSKRMYVVYGCRCDLCRAANLERRRGERSRKRDREAA